MAACAAEARESRTTFQSLPVGTSLGRYQILQVLGRGNMGVVYLGHDSQLNRQVAIKVAWFDGSGSLLAERLAREARAVAVLSHPNICPIFEIGVHDGMHFIAMGLVSGRPLSEYIRSGKPLPERDAVKVVRKIALALHEAHEHGILHRDLKPANIMIDKRAEPIVMDFGLAYWLKEHQSQLTQVGTVVGTPAYMSPEQIDAREKLGPKSDLYSLGVVFYELLAGRCPFEGSVVSVMHQILTKEPTPIAELRPEISPVAAQICAKAMAKNPADRFESMLEFASALSAFLSGAPSGIIERRAPAAATIAAKEIVAVETPHRANANTPQNDAPTPFISEIRPLGRRLLVGFAGAVVMLLGVIALLLAGVLMKYRHTATVAAKVDEQSKTQLGARAESDHQPQLTATSIPAHAEGHEPRKGGRRPPFHGPPHGGRPEPIHPNRLESLPIDEQFRFADRNEDQSLDPAELPLHLIRRADVNDDGELTIDEYNRAVEEFGKDFYGPPSDEEREEFPEHPGPPRGRGPAGHHHPQR